MAEHSPDFTRVATTFHHEEPDRVPLAEFAVDYSIMSKYLGATVSEDDLAAQVRFWVAAGYDFIPLTVGMMNPGAVTKESQISKTIQKTYLAEGEGDESEDWSILKKPRILSDEDCDRFPWEEAAKLDFGKLDEVQPLLPRGMKIVVLSGKIFTLAWMLMGFEGFGINLMTNPRLVEKVSAKVARIQLDGLRHIVDVPNVAAVCAVDDLAFGSGSIISPRAYRQFLLPWYEEFGELCRKSGFFFIFHTDGLVWDLIEDLIAVGVDALHPIDPTCMDIEDVKEKVGHRLSLIGNISTELLEAGTPEDVAELTKTRLRRIAPGGGYCIGSGNSVPAWARIENYRSMVDTSLQYGNYPIGLG